MSRFIWLIRREVWEHKAIWIAPAVVLACIVLLMVTGNVHIDPYDAAAMPQVTPEQKVRLLTYIYSAVALPVFMVMGIVSFFYSLDSLYADRRDRSVLFWKSLPLSDAETVLAKFAVAIVLIPLVAVAATVIAQLLIAAGESMKAGISGVPAGFLWDPEGILGGVTVALLWSLTAMLWYAPFVGYLMLASAWAPRAPFLWAVLPPVGAWILEKFIMNSDHIGHFIAERLFMVPYMRLQVEKAVASTAGSKLERLTSLDLHALLGAFYTSAELWLGVLAAALLLVAAMWVRRYRDETT